RAQDELFAGGDFICPATVAPAGGAERTGDGHWVLTGTWNYCSGAPYASHFIAHTLVSPAPGQPPEPMMFIAPRSQWELVEDRGVVEPAERGQWGGLLQPGLLRRGAGATGRRGCGLSTGRREVSGDVRCMLGLVNGGSGAAAPAALMYCRAPSLSSASDLTCP